MFKRSLALIIFFLVLLIACTVSSTGSFDTGNTDTSGYSVAAPKIELPNEANLLTAPDWDQGGNLHHATAYSWVSASLRNRLATSADFVKKRSRPENTEALKSAAVTMEQCISGTIPRDGRIVSVKVEQLAQMCLNKFYRR
jgi:hypothetical protein